ncbi:MAG: Asp-tRNA(Asn)/Glu-tRNA(Gln) amidotransferase subunit GatC [Deltaproteobacteria bacterium]|jgi:aspartyl-tRNA(Asn)/glutamyl-tRNA(Gln) amidotransferase subunit C
MAIEVEEVRRIAKLARLELSDESLLPLTDDIGRILEHVEQLQSVDVEGIEPTAHGVDLAPQGREDRATEARDGARLLDGVPRRAADAVVVPRVLD